MTTPTHLEVLAVGYLLLELLQHLRHHPQLRALRPLRGVVGVRDDPDEAHEPADWHHKTTRPSLTSGSSNLMLAAAAFMWPPPPRGLKISSKSTHEMPLRARPISTSRFVCFFPVVSCSYVI